MTGVSKRQSVVKTFKLIPVDPKLNELFMSRPILSDGTGKGRTLVCGKIQG